MQVVKKPDSETKSLTSPLLRQPYVRLKVIEGQDIFLNNDNKQENGDLYAKICYATEPFKKTNTINKTSSPRWNKSFEFNYVAPEEAAHINIISISVFDSDPLGGDQILATILIPINYFVQTRKHIKPIDIWVQMTYVNKDSSGEEFVFDAEENIIPELKMPDFDNQILSEEALKKSSANIPKLHLLLEIYDEMTINHFRVAIIDVAEMKDSGAFSFKVFIYTIKVCRNDGTDWTIKKRYSDVRDLRERLLKLDVDVKGIPFPEKDMLKFLSHFLTSQEDQYNKQGQERKTMLEDFLNQLCEMPFIYNFDDFLTFFTTSR